MTSSVEDTVLDPTFLLPQDDPDILDEFLDQRVYESIHTTPQPPFDDPSVPKQSQYLYDDPLAMSFEPSPAPVTEQTSPIQAPSHLSPGSSESRLDDYDYIRDELTKLKFGNPHMNPCPESVDVPDPSYINFSPEVMSRLPYRLDISPLPAYSRVETQIKLQLSISPSPKQMLLHIPQDLVSKHKFCLGDPLSELNPRIKESMLHLDAYVLTSDLTKSCTICSRCIKREQKRASRRKPGFSENTDDSNGLGPGASSWADENMKKKALIFNCKEVMSFPAPNGVDDHSEKTMELSARIICYCRHHKEATGFKLLFVVKDNNGNVVAKSLSSPIMIMDRKKTSSTSAPSSSVVKTESQPSSVMNSSTNLIGLGDGSHFDQRQSLSHSSPSDSMPGLSPHSVDESESQSEISHLLGLTVPEERRPLKRKKLSVDDSHNQATNPMFNGQMGFSPVSNSDTNTSTQNYLTMKPSLAVPMAGSQSGPQPTLPFIQRIIPAQGPIRGGIEVTLLGFNFHQGLAVKFGANQALATHCWSETTIVTYLPPAAHPGQVLVSFENQPSMMGGTQQQQVFTYTDDTDRQLIELALQIVGLKMNGKLEDAKNIARRIVGSDAGSGASSMASSPSANQTQRVEGTQQWFDRAHQAVEQLVAPRQSMSTETILINLLSLVDLPNCPIVMVNWQLMNGQGQTAMHLATLKGYSQLVKFLLNHGTRADIKDNQGVTPLFLASMTGHRQLMTMFLECQCNGNLRMPNQRYLQDYCDPNVLDVFNAGDFMVKRGSVDSLSSMLNMSVGRHVSRMVNAPLNDDDESNSTTELASELADSEYESEDDQSEVGEEPQPAPNAIPERHGLWQRVKNAFNGDSEDEMLPSYDDLFPFGQSQDQAKPKSAIERMLNNQPATVTDTTGEDPGVTSDSSEDMVISYINHPRKSMENDKMLFFFWLPMLMITVAVLFMVSVMGYRFESIEGVKLMVRNSVGNLMVGSDRISRVFKEKIAG
ncbi:hypothetical protein DIURU_005460 [Diutina rugosa]|uniref:IPT/TIG domain-containing protein n=1 Tax=Diutina rugosa TaxID=5481 RepID=A0A642UCZ2_DIURU|nr:uncharacterized protein DIURU_005460 [Diutina rugosa]KAA8896947.1 hypothetical protein DIURU_005460 [Diutina rugosa]